MEPYKTQYDELISEAKNRKIKHEPFKFEMHHIIPRCMGGTDDKENLVLLTVREHFRAHVLLANMYPENGKLALACTRMLVGWQKIDLPEAEEEFEYLRGAAARYISAIHKGRKVTDEFREKIRQIRYNAPPRKFSEDAVANMSEARKRTWADRKENGTVQDIIKKTVAARKENGSYKHTEERKKRISEMQIGRIPWNKGKTNCVSDEARRKMSLAKKGKPSPHKGTKTGKPSWNSGKKGVSEETRAKMQAARMAYLAKQQLL